VLHRRQQDVQLLPFGTENGKRKLKCVQQHLSLVECKEAESINSFFENELITN
jgi:hypothetical protein